MRTKCFLKVMLILLVAVGARCLHAQATEPDPDTASAASGPSSALVAPFGVPLAPPIYLTNFSLLYFANPEIAADLPAYRAALPQKVYNCLFENPDGCPYAAMAPFFAEQAAGGGGSPLQKTVWPSSCQTGPAWRGLAPHEERHPFQINQPLGRENADQLAKVLGITEDVILTASEYQCMVGEPPRGPAREIIHACSRDLTNSKGNAEIPLSSYGLYINSNGDVRSNCAPEAPCLEFNKLFAGPLEAIAIECGFADKLARLVKETAFLQFIGEGSRCQTAWMPSCIAEAPCVGKGGQSNNECAAPIAPAPQ